MGSGLHVLLLVRMVREGVLIFQSLSLFLSYGPSLFCCSWGPAYTCCNRQEGLERER